MKKMKNLQLEGSFTKYDHFMRVSMDKNEENATNFSPKISIITHVRQV